MKANTSTFKMITIAVVSTIAMSASPARAASMDEMKLAVAGMVEYLLNMQSILDPEVIADSVQLSNPAVYDAEYYLAANPSLRPLYGNDRTLLLLHWTRIGAKKGLRASPKYWSKRYLKLNKDVAKVVGATDYREATLHYIKFGRKQHRKAI